MSTSSNLRRSDTHKVSLRHLILTGMLLAVLIAQEQLLIFLPNIQLTVVLIMVYAAILPGYLLVFLVLGYVLLDNLIMGSFSLIYTPPMLLAWLMLALIGRLVRDRSMIVILLAALLFGFLYGWVFIPFNMIVYGLNVFWPYLASDLPFEIVMAVNNYFTVLLLYRPLTALLRPFATSQPTLLDSTEIVDTPRNARAESLEEHD